MLSGGDSDSSRQCLHSKTDNSTAGANVYGSVCECVCVEKRESLLLTSLPRSVLRSFSLPSLAPFLLPALWLLSPFLLYTFFLSSLLALSVSLSLSLSLYPLLSLSLAVHHFWRWMSPRLKLRRLFPWLAAIHKLAIKKKGERKTRQKSMGGGEGGGGRKYCPYIPVSISWLWNRETGEVRGWRRGWTLGRHTVFFPPLFLLWMHPQSCA